MKYLKFLLTGILFGILLSKAEIISWYRIYEMFRFESFHMYGIIGSTILLGIPIVQFIKKTRLEASNGEKISFTDKNKRIPRYLWGGILFGLGWALVGVCPGPMFTLIGYGYLSILVVILGSLLGTFSYGLLRNKLPH